jgi:hypothetical protein
VSDLVLDASLTLQWFFEDESGRDYALGILASLSSKRATVPILWLYEVGNGLLMAHRRKRITFDQIDGFLTRLKALPIKRGAAGSKRDSRTAGSGAEARPDELRRRVLGACDAPEFALGNDRRRSAEGRSCGGRRDGSWVDLIPTPPQSAIGRGTRLHAA